MLVTITINLLFLSICLSAMPVSYIKPYPFLTPGDTLTLPLTIIYMDMKSLRGSMVL